MLNTCVVIAIDATSSENGGHQQPEHAVGTWGFIVISLGSCCPSLWHKSILWRKGILRHTCFKKTASEYGREGVGHRLAGWIVTIWLGGWLAGWLAGCWLAGWSPKYVSERSLEYTTSQLTNHVKKTKKTKKTNKPKKTILHKLSETDDWQLECLFLIVSGELFFLFFCFF